MPANNSRTGRMGGPRRACARRAPIRRALLLATVLAAGVSPVPAWSQVAAPDPQGTAVLVLEPVTVSARRRDETVQEAPVAVTVIGADRLGRGRTNTLEDTAFRAANTLFSAQGGPLSIRGIGSLGISGGVDRQPGVGIFLDEVYIARPFGNPLFLGDIEQVEVVRGSQATLYGKNTIGGAINLITAEPGEGPLVSAEATVGTERGFDSPFGRLSAAFDTPLGASDFALHGYASWNGAQGYIENSDGDTVSDSDTLSTRLALKGWLSDATTLKVALDYSRTRDDGGLWYAPLPLAFDYKTDHDYVARNELDIGGLLLRLEHDFGAMTLTSITAVRGHEMYAALDGDFTSLPYIVQAQSESQRQVSQELRLASNEAGDFEWRAGLFYMHEWFEGDQFFDYAAVPAPLWSRTTFEQQTDTYSVFAELSYDLLPMLEVIGGLRYTFERKTATAETSSPSGTFLFGAPGRASDTASFHNLSPELSLVFRPSEAVLAFAKVSRGFKSGGISPFIDLGNQPNRYDPEITTSYEIGVKTNWLDQRLTVNASLFYIDWQDQQAVIYTSPFTRVIRNAAAATSKGFELEGAARLSEGLTLSAYYGYLDASYDDFTDSVLGADHSGNQLPFAPEHSAGASLGFELPLAGGLTLQSSLDYSYRSSYAFNPDNLYRQDATHLVDASIGIAGEGWSASLWAKNLLDEDYLRQYFSYSGTDMGVAARGASFGLTLKMSW